jgi:MATE family multidrug resistance protein
MGLVMAASPMMAKQLGMRRHSVRDVRRTVRQALWAATAITLPVWLILWHTEGISWSRWARIRRSPPMRAASPIPCNGRCCRRSTIWSCAPSSRRWSGRAGRSIVGLCGVACNATVNYGLIFGHFGLPALGLTGAGIGTTMHQHLHVPRHGRVVTFHPRFRRYHLFGRFWRPDWERFREVWRLGLPIAVTLALEITIFNTAVFLMGLIGAESVAAHAIALQIAALTFMVPLGLSQAATVRVGLAFGRRDRDGVARAGWTAFALGVSFMALMAAVMLGFPHQLVSLFLEPDRPRQPAGHPARNLLPVRRCTVPDFRRRAVGGRRHAARPPGHQGADGLCRLRLLGDRPRRRPLARFRAPLGGRGHLDRARHRARDRRRADARPLDPARAAGAHRLVGKARREPP